VGQKLKNQLSGLSSGWQRSAAVNDGSVYYRPTDSPSPGGSFEHLAVTPDKASGSSQTDLNNGIGRALGSLSNSRTDIDNPVNSTQIGTGQDNAATEVNLIDLSSEDVSMRDKPVAFDGDENVSCEANNFIYDSSVNPKMTHYDMMVTDSENIPSHGGKLIHGVSDVNAETTDHDVIATENENMQSSEDSLTRRSPNVDRQMAGLDFSSMATNSEQVQLDNDDLTCKSNVRTEIAHDLIVLDDVGTENQSTTASQLDCSSTAELPSILLNDAVEAASTGVRADRPLCRKQSLLKMSRSESSLSMSSGTPPPATPQAATSAHNLREMQEIDRIDDDADIASASVSGGVSGFSRLLQGGKLAASLMVPRGTGMSAAAAASRRRQLEELAKNRYARSQLRFKELHTHIILL